MNYICYQHWNLSFCLFIRNNASCLEISFDKILRNACNSSGLAFFKSISKTLMLVGRDFSFGVGNGDVAGICCALGLELQYSVHTWSRSSASIACSNQQEINKRSAPNIVLIQPNAQVLQIWIKLWYIWFSWNDVLNWVGDLNMFMSPIYHSLWCESFLYKQ